MYGYTYEINGTISIGPGQSVETFDGAQVTADNIVIGPNASANFSTGNFSLSSTTAATFDLYFD